jgi:hypothetical protein
MRANCIPGNGILRKNFFDPGAAIGGADGGSMSADDVDIGGHRRPPLHPDCRCYLRPEEISIK